MSNLHCPGCSSTLEQERKQVTITFRGESLSIDREAYICPSCGLEAGTVRSVGTLQRAIAEAYRRHKGLLTGEQIRTLRTARNMTHEQLAKALSVNTAAVRRWETAAIQPATMDRLLRSHLEDQHTSQDVGSGDA